MDNQFAFHEIVCDAGYQQQAARVWVLIIHYEFENNPALRREANKPDLIRLRATISHYSADYCTLKEIASPSPEEVINVLKMDLKNIFSGEETPTLFLLFILSHGEENGKILTDSGHFTTFQVWDCLKQNDVLKESLKITFFGPCRGNINETRPTSPKKIKLDAGIISTRILGPPNEQNFINFFSAVETTKATVVNAEGSWMVRSFCNTLATLNKNLEVVEFLRRMECDITNSSSLGNYQTPQFTVFPHTRTYFCKRPGSNGCLISSDAKKENNGPLITAERFDFYPWSSSGSVILKKGPALIFTDQQQTPVVQNLAVSLQQLEFQPEIKNLSSTLETLHNVSVHNMINEGCLLIVIIAPIVDLGIGDQRASGLAVHLGEGSIVPIGDLVRKFVVYENATFAGKPKVLILLDTQMRSDKAFSHKLDESGLNTFAGNNHSDLLVTILTSNEQIDELVSSLKSPRLVEGTASLQELVTDVICNFPSHSNRFAQMWSTMPKKLDFPKCKNLYIKHRFMSGGAVSYFDDFVSTLVSCKHRVVLVHGPPGAGKSRASQEVHSQLVVKLASHIVVHRRLSRMLDYWVEFDGSSEEKTPSAKSFLKSCVDPVRTEEMMARLQEGHVFVILDGFDEICPRSRMEVLNMVKMLVEVNAYLLLTSRPQEKHTILDVVSQFATIEEFRLAELLIREKVLMLQTRLNLPKEKCAATLHQLDFAIKGFAGNPLHLEMICDLFERKEISLSSENVELSNMYSIYLEFLEQKIDHGLLTCRQMDKRSYGFTDTRNKIMSTLTKCAIALVSENIQEVPTLDDEEILCINLSGVATIVDAKSPIQFVHRTFAEFLAAKRCIDNCFGVTNAQEKSFNLETVFTLNKPTDPLKQTTSRNLFQRFSIKEQTFKFIDSGLLKFQGKTPKNIGFPDYSQTNKHLIFEVICKLGLPNVYLFLLDKLFTESDLKEFLSQQNKFDLYVQACQSSTQLASLLSNLCPEFYVDHISEAVEMLATNNKSRKALEVLLSRIENWQGVWPKAEDVFAQSKHGNLLSVEQFTYVLELCPDLDEEGLVQMFHSMDDFKGYSRVDLLPFLLDHGLNLTLEKKGLKLLNMFYGCSRGVISLIKHAAKVAGNFKNAFCLIDSAQTQILRRTIGAMSPQELGLNWSEEGDRRKYLEHIDDRLSGILDGGRCSLNFALAMTEDRQLALEEFYKAGGNDFQRTRMHFDLYIMRVCVRKDAVKFFEKMCHLIPKNFRYMCGCTLAHDAALRGNLQLLQALADNDFVLTAKNCDRYTPLHFAALMDYGCTEFLLMRLLGNEFISPKKNEKVRPWTEQRVALIERALKVTLKEGVTPIYLADDDETELLLNYNLPDFADV